MEPIEFIKKYLPDLYDEEFIKQLIDSQNIAANAALQRFGNNMNKQFLCSNKNWSFSTILQQCMNHHKPDRMYHYTSIESLSSILKSQSLWLFHYSRMNDPHEITYGIKCIQTCIEEMFESKKIQRSKAIAILNSIESEFVDDKKNKTCFSSFTTEPNHLPYWRWYGNDGKGVCIEFKTDSFKSYLHKVIYDEETFKEMIKYSLKSIKPTLLGGYSGLLNFTSIAKANYYKEEKEWRIITPYNRLEETFINGRRKKYTELKLDTNNFPITKVIIGPSASQEAKSYICDLVNNKIEHEIDIEFTDISYNSESILVQATLEHRTKLLKKLGAI